MPGNTRIRRRATRASGSNIINRSDADGGTTRVFTNRRRVERQFPRASNRSGSSGSP